MPCTYCNDTNRICEACFTPDGNCDCDASVDKCYVCGPFKVVPPPWASPELKAAHEARWPERKDWDSYFLRIAAEVATRATCPRKAVGAVLVRDRSILSTGYNGSIRGTPHCDEVGCQMENGSCVRTVHAEVNAISQAARAGTSIEGATIYCTYSPCWTCFKQIANSGIVRIVFAEAYHKGVGHLYGVPGIETVHYTGSSSKGRE